MPYNLEAEQSVLGAILLRPAALKEVTKELEVGDFYEPRNRSIYRAMLDLDKAREPIDVVIVSNHLKVQGKLDVAGGQIFLSQLSEHVGTAANAGYYAKLVREAATRRQLQTDAQELSRKAADAQVPIKDLQLFLESLAHDISSRNGGDGKGQLTISAKDLGAMTFADPSWIIPGILGGGYVILAGKPKLGKSWLGLSLAVAVATGGCALGKVELQAAQGAVLYLALEDRWRRIQKRLGQILCGQPFPDNLHVAESWPRLDKGGLESLRKHLMEYPECRLVVIDTLAKVRPPRSKNRDLYEFDMATGSTFQALANEFQVCILVVHHTRKTRKSEADDPLDEVSGSTGLTGSADAVMVLQRARGKADGTLSLTGRDIEEQELALKFHPDEGMWELMGEAADYAKSQTRLEIINVLAEHGPKTPKEVAEILGKKPDTIRQRMWHMAKSGEIKAGEVGKYETL